uniref:Uncharacterized protein n=1 Tax=Oryza nivara TaxID=4536 RepID=A0A0E0GDH7_ORYNI
MMIPTASSAPRRIESAVSEESHDDRTENEHIIHDHEHRHHHHHHEFMTMNTNMIIMHTSIPMILGVHIIFQGRIMWEPNEPCINKIVFIVNNLKWGRTGETASKIAYSTEGISEKRDSNRWCILQSNQSTT